MKSLKDYIIEANKAPQKIYDTSTKYKTGSAFWQTEVIKYIYRFLLIYGFKKRGEKVYKTEHNQYFYKLDSKEILRFGYDKEHLEILKGEDPEATDIVPEIRYSDNKVVPVCDLEMDQLKELYDKLKKIENVEVK